MSKISFASIAGAGMIALALPMSAHGGGDGGYPTGVYGGMTTGAVIGVPIGGPYYGPTYTPLAGYEPFSYYAPFPVDCPGGYWARRPFLDRWGNVVGYSHPRFFCP